VLVPEVKKPRCDQGGFFFERSCEGQQHEFIMHNSCDMAIRCR